MSLHHIWANRHNRQVEDNMARFFSLDYFITYFKDIPEEQLCLVKDTNKGSSHLAMGDAWEWLDDEEQDALYTIIRPYGLLVHVNDGFGEFIHMGTTPKQRVIAFLQQIKEGRACLL
jgi:hypothetical protein